MTNQKKIFNCFTKLIAALFLVQAQAVMAWPTRPVQMLVGFPAGGSVDVLARAFGEALSARLGQSVVVVNRDGASGTIGMAAGAKAEDGNTIVFGPAGPLVLQPHIKPNLPYKFSDMVGICQTFVNNYALVTSPNFSNILCNCTSVKFFKTLAAVRVWRLSIRISKLASKRIEKPLSASSNW